jgi:hypothetical protein
MSIPIRAKLPIKEKRGFKTYQQVFHRKDMERQKKIPLGKRGIFLMFLNEASI